MSDGFKSAVGQIGADMQEAVIKPVSDEVGKSIEQGVQSVVSGPPPVDPVSQQKKQEENQKKLAWAQKVIGWYKHMDDSQKKVRQEQQQKTQFEEQKEQQDKQVKQYKAVEKQQKGQQLTSVQQAARKTEIRGGVGG